MIKLFDAHTHVQFAAFDPDRRAVIKRAHDLEVGLINVGTKKNTSEQAVALAEKYESGIYATVGLHPIHTDKSFHDVQEIGGSDGKGLNSRGEEFDYEYYKKLAKHPKVVAIGECGLDYYRLEAENEKRKTQIGKQEMAFKKQVELAKELNKPLMLHCRASKDTDDAYIDALEILKTNEAFEAGKLKAIFHFYAGPPAITKKLLEFGAYFTFGGVITFVRDYDATIDLIPLERIMLETDAPYVAPIPHRGKRNEPAYVVEVAKKMAELKGVDYDTICKVTTKTVKNVFKV